MIAGEPSPERKYPRHAVHVPLYVSLEGSLYHKPVALESKDVSGGGLAFVTRSRLPIDAASRVIVSRLGDLPSSAQILARVAYRREDPETGGYTVGLEFTEFVDVTRDELLARIEGWRG